MYDRMWETLAKRLDYLIAEATVRVLVEPDPREVRFFQGQWDALNMLKNDVEEIAQADRTTDGYRKLQEEWDGPTDDSPDTAA